jgi:hypothetical protein
MIDHTPSSDPVVGRELGKQLIASFARAFPDTTSTVDVMVAEADSVAAFVSYRSTDTSPFMGHPPTGKVVRVNGMDIMGYRDRQVVELWGQFDDLGLLQQLDIVPRLEDRQPLPSRRAAYSETKRGHGIKSACSGFRPHAALVKTTV